jgi:hypothetical protein
MIGSVARSPAGASPPPPRPNLRTNRRIEVLASLSLLYPAPRSPFTGRGILRSVLASVFGVYFIGP